MVHPLGEEIDVLRDRARVGVVDERPRRDEREIRGRPTSRVFGARDRLQQVWRGAGAAADGSLASPEPLPCEPLLAAALPIELLLAPDESSADQDDRGVAIETGPLELALQRRR